MGYSFRLTARVLLYASSNRQDNTYHDLCCTSRGALAGTRNSSMGSPHGGSIRRLAQWANLLPRSYISLLSSGSSSFNSSSRSSSRSSSNSSSSNRSSRSSSSMCVGAVNGRIDGKRSIKQMCWETEKDGWTPEWKDRHAVKQDDAVVAIVHSLSLHIPSWG